MGPLISRQHREKVLSYYELAKKEGAKVVTGGACLNRRCARLRRLDPADALDRLPETARTV